MEENPTSVKIIFKDNIPNHLIHTEQRADLKQFILTLKKIFLSKIYLFT